MIHFFLMGENDFNTSCSSRLGPRTPPLSPLSLGKLIHTHGFIDHLYIENSHIYFPAQSSHLNPTLVSPSTYSTCPLGDLKLITSKTNL